MIDRNSRRLARTAHDVRHLCTCPGCDGLADDRDTIAGMHPSCFYEAHCDAAVVALGEDDRNKFRLCDIPAALAKRLLTPIRARRRVTSTSP